MADLGERINRFLGLSDETDEPLTGVVDESVTYTGDEPSYFKTVGEPSRFFGSSWDTMRVSLEGNAPDKGHMTGALQYVSTGAGDDWVRLAGESETLNLSTLDLGAGDDTVELPYTSRKNMENNLVIGGEGTDTILLNPNTTYYFIKDAQEADGMPPAEVPFRIANAGTSFNDFEQLRFDVLTRQGIAERHSFDLNAISEKLPETEQFSVYFGPESNALYIQYNQDGQRHEETLYSKEVLDGTYPAQSCTLISPANEAEEIAPPAATPTPEGQAPAIKSDGRGTTPR